MLAQRQETGYADAYPRSSQGWTAIQIAEEQLLDGLKTAQEQWAKYNDRNLRKRAADQFHKYAYQWY